MSRKIESVLVVGSGGREHALAWKVAPDTEQLYIAKGNAGTQQLGTNVSIDPTDIHGLLDFAEKNDIQLTIVGPEEPLAKDEGIVNLFERHNRRIFGATKEAAMLETSKVWATEFMARYNIPHPESHIFDDSDKALAFVENASYELVVKADGLAKGKGVIVASSKSEAMEAVERMMVNGEFGEAGDKIVIQKKEQGPEVSVFLISDGTHVVLLLTAQDHKRIFEGDKGPNTGGMGAYAPIPTHILSSEQLNDIYKRVAYPTIKGMQKEGRTYKGVLYLGMMLTPEGPKVLEYNARLGDPEAQPILMLLVSPLGPLIESCINGTLRKSQARFKKGAAACIVLASDKYPESSTKGVAIEGLASALINPNVEVFHAGTALVNGKTVTDGGRVLGITGFGRTVAHALYEAYYAIGANGIHFEEMQYRRDIGWQATHASTPGVEPHISKGT